MFFNTIMEQCIEYSRVQLLLIKCWLANEEETHLLSRQKSQSKRGGGLLESWLGTAHFGHFPSLLIFLLR